MKVGTIAVATPLGMVRRLAVRTEDAIVDATAARIAFLERSLYPSVADRVGSAQVPPDMVQMLDAGEQGLDWIREGLEFVVAGGCRSTSGGMRTVYDPADVQLAAPIPRPPGIANFSAWADHIAHAREKGINLAIPTKEAGPQSYWKGNALSVVAPGTPLVLPSYANKLDAECEVVAVVGRPCKDVSVSEAEKSIVGYSIFNDVSLRETQVAEMKHGRGPAKGKDHDGGNVLGPWLVTADEVGDPMSLDLSLHVNGEQWSSSNTSGMVFSFAEMLSYLSRGQTITPGHLISGGSYTGGSGFDLDRQVRTGDTVELRVARLGSQICPVA